MSEYPMSEYAQMQPAEIRKLFRADQLVQPTSGMAKGFTQANLVILPQKLAFDFLLFAQRNPKPCPVLDVTEVGSPEPRMMAPGADLRYDLPKYRIYRHGTMTEEVLNLEKYWRDDLVAFLLGCSFTFESALLEAGIPIRHMEEKHNVPMYITNMQCRPAGGFHGPTVVSMRPIPQNMVVRAVQITSRFPAVHGAPLHIGDPATIGIRDIAKPDFGDPDTIRLGETPVFWACGVTPQAVAMTVKPELMITHAPGYMFICDVRDHNMSVL